MLILHHCQMQISLYGTSTVLWHETCWTSIYTDRVARMNLRASHNQVNESIIQEITLWTHWPYSKWNRWKCSGLEPSLWIWLYIGAHDCLQNFARFYYLILVRKHIIHIQTILTKLDAWAKTKIQEHFYSSRVVWCPLYSRVLSPKCY